MKPSHLFITGAPRSGTTLADKLVSAHERASVLSQPLPLLYVRLKRDFIAALREEGFDIADTAYPLSDMFAKNYYPPSRFVEFLERFELSRQYCRRSLEEMIPYDGQYTKPSQPLGVQREFDGGSLFDFVQRYCLWMARFSARSRKLQVIGSKETSCEEYIPYLLKNGSKILMLVRDPRDLIASLNYGRGTDFGGRSKPHLFNLRQWRKSVAFAMAFESEPLFRFIRYENLVAKPNSALQGIGEFLGLVFPDKLAEGVLKTRDGEIWRSNSSHFRSSTITTASVGRYRRCLDRTTDLWIQAICANEFRRLGYPLEIGDSDVLPILKGYRETEGLERPELASYLWTEDRFEEERWRHLSLREGRFDPAFFLFERAFQELRSQAA